MLRISLEEDVCIHWPHAPWGGWFDWQKNLPRITAGELQRLFESWGQKVSKTTIRRHLHHHKLFGRVARKKPLLSIINKLQRLKFVKCKSDFQWDRVKWSDETKIKLFGNKHQRWVWRRQKDSHTDVTGSYFEVVVCFLSGNGTCLL